MNTTTTPNTTTAATPPVRTEAQTARSFALDRASAHTLDLARQIRTACESDQKKPLGQRERAQLRTDALRNLRNIQSQIERVFE